MKSILNAKYLDDCVEIEKVGRITFEPFNGFDSPDMNENIITSGKNLMTILGSFHAREVRVLKCDDNYLFGIRADTHLFEFGYSEYDYKDYMIHTGNHKGQRIIDIYTY